MAKPKQPVWPPGHPKAGQPYNWLEDNPANPNWHLGRQQTQYELYQRGDW